jgi:hypothetical protein
MTDDPLDRYLDDFGRTLHHAAAEGRPRRDRRRFTLLAAATAATAAAVLVALLALPGGSATRRLDVLAEARAAITPRPGRLTHLVVRQTAVAPPNRPDMHVSAPPTTTEQWSVADPPRWRIAFSYPEPGGPGGTVVDRGGIVSGPVQVAYADGTESTYKQRRNTLRRVTGFSDHGPAANVPGSTPLGNDPIAALRAMLARGALHDAGTAAVGDREVRRLLGSDVRTFGSVRVVTKVEYDVDPETFTPVRARVELPIPAKGDDRFASVLEFLAYERLPLTTQNAKLLQIQPVGPPPAITVTKARRPRQR